MKTAKVCSSLSSLSPRLSSPYPDPGSSSNDQVIPLPDPDTGLCTGDEIIGIQGSRTCATGKQYEIRVRDCNMIEDVVWVGKAVEQRADFQYHWSSGGYAV